MANDVLQLVRAEVDASAGQLHRSGAAVSAVASTLGSCGFSSSCSGRIYSAQGSAVQTGVQQVAQTVTAWSTADDTVGTALTTAAAALDSTDGSNRGDLSGVS